MPDLVDENKEKIGKFIEDRVNEWNEKRFIEEMEREIGPDLQYIRINGTVVGGLASLGIFLVSKALARGLNQSLRRREEGPPPVAAFDDLTVDDISLPKIHEGLLALMGISHAGYLGSKSVTKTPTA